MEEHKDKYGLNKVLQVIGMAKSTWYYGQRRKSYEAKYEYLRKPLMERAEEHPEYGYRRTTAELVNGKLNSYGYGKQNSHGHGKQKSHKDGKWNSHFKRAPVRFKKTLQERK